MAHTGAAMTFRALAQQALPPLVEMCADVLKEVGRDWLRTKMVNGHQAVQVAGPVRGESPSAPEGCPFCAAGKKLAAAHLYLDRLGRAQGEYRAIYQRLALQQCEEADDALQRAPADLDPRTVALLAQVTEIQAVLSTPTAAYQAAAIDRKVWAAADLCMDLAQRFNSEASQAERRAQDMEAQARELERRAQERMAHVVEGTVVG